MSVGRPVKQRNPGSGEKLLRALKLSGLAWGNTSNLKNHVLNNNRWSQCNLPKSSNTLVNDIKNGIPEDRLAKYAKFFDVDPVFFIDDNISPYSKEFECEVLQSKHKLATNASFPALEVDKMFCHVLHEQNDPDRNFKLYTLLSGIYRVSLKEMQSSAMVNGVIHVHSHNKSFFIADGYLKYADVEILINSIIFKWSTFLHIHYYTQNCSVVGYMIAQDPSCSPYSLLKEPLTLELFGLAGSMISTSVPDRFHGYAEKLNTPEAMSQTDYYLALCDKTAATNAVDASSHYAWLSNKDAAV
jgi:hypothetical protein